MKYKYKQKFLADWEMEWYIAKNRRWLWVAGVVLVLLVLWSGLQ